MRYVSIDIETSGLNPDNCQILEFAAVCDDLSDPQPVNELPVFHRYVSHKSVINQSRSNISGEPYALALNYEIMKYIAEAENKETLPDNVVSYTRLADEFDAWLISLGYVASNKTNKVFINPAGKNFSSFDRVFLEKLPSWQYNISMSHRALDPGILYWEPGDRRIPDTALCCKRAGLSEEQTHRAVDDALQVIQLLRFKLLGEV